MSQNRDEDDVGCDPEDAKAGEEEGGHLLVIGAGELDLGHCDVFNTSWSPQSTFDHRHLLGENNYSNRS